jgi:predicted oxidoreductase
MKTITIKNTSLEVTQIGYGCMELGENWSSTPPTPETQKRALISIETALDEGINFFDHADIYCRGKSEELFSQIWSRRSSLRQRIILQSKCGIRFANDPIIGYPARFDFSQQYIVDSVEGILKRLQTDYIDLLLLHRPDALIEPQEVAKAFDYLYNSGKVRYFGVSNHTPGQIELLKKFLNQSLVVNQLELNVLHTHIIDEGIVANQDIPKWPVRGNGILDYCRLNEITIQAWSPLAKGKASGGNLDLKDKRALTVSSLVETISRKRNVSLEAIIIAWILRHPAQIQPIIGTTNPSRIRASCEADQVVLTREEWYELFTAGRGAKLP